MALRLLAFKQIYKILGMDMIVWQANNGRMAKKRHYQTGENESNQVDEKKIKDSSPSNVPNSQPIEQELQPVAKIELNTQVA